MLQILEAIEDGRWKDRIEALRAEDDEGKRKDIKFNLPCVTFSGTFHKRQAEEVKAYSNIVVLDVDSIRGKKLKKLKKNLRNDGHVAAYFESPSQGLKILFHVSSDVEYHKEYAFPLLERYMDQYYDVDVDPSGKDVSRLCFVSYDPNLYYNDCYQIFKVDISRQNYFKSVKDQARDLPDTHEISYNVQHIFTVCDKMVRGSRIGDYSKGNRNNFIYALACNLNRGGVNQEDALSLVYSRYGSLKFTEVETTVESAYRHRKNEFGIKPIWQKKTPQVKVFKDKNL